MIARSGTWNIGKEMINVQCTWSWPNRRKPSSWRDNFSHIYIFKRHHNKIPNSQKNFIWRKFSPPPLPNSCWLNFILQKQNFFGCMVLKLILAFLNFFLPCFEWTWEQSEPAHVQHRRCPAIEGQGSRPPFGTFASRPECGQSQPSWRHSKVTGQGLWMTAVAGQLLERSV